MKVLEQHISDDLNELNLTSFSLNDVHMLDGCYRVVHSLHGTYGRLR